MKHSPERQRIELDKFNDRCRAMCAVAGALKYHSMDPRLIDFLGGFYDDMMEILTKGEVLLDELEREAKV